MDKFKTILGYILFLVFEIIVAWLIVHYFFHEDVYSEQPCDDNVDLIKELTLQSFLNYLEANLQAEAGWSSEFTKKMMERDFNNFLEEFYIANNIFQEEHFKKFISKDFADFLEEYKKNHEIFKNKFHDFFITENFSIFVRGREFQRYKLDGVGFDVGRVITDFQPYDGVKAMEWSSSNEYVNDIFKMEDGNFFISSVNDVDKFYSNLIKRHNVHGLIPAEDLSKKLIANFIYTNGYYYESSDVGGVFCIKFKIENYLHTYDDYFCNTDVCKTRTWLALYLSPDWPWNIKGSNL